MSILLSALPFLFVLLAAAAVAVIIAVLTVKNDVYDERQMAARGLAHRDGFLSLMVFMLLYIIALVWLEPEQQLSINLAMTALFAGMDVFLTSCILRGAYVPINQNPKRSVISWAFVAAMYLVMLCLNPRELFQKGIYSDMWIQFLGFIEFTLITLLMLTRMALDKKNEET